MPGYLRQSTASQSRALGPFVDDTDFKSAETGLTIANTDIKLVVNGGASANKNSGGGTHRVNGVYGVTFDATDTATVGEMEVSVFVSGALPVFDKFFVIEEAVYDALYAASAAGYQVPIWAAANSTVNLSATTIKTATDVETDTQDIQGRVPAALTGGGNMKADALAWNGLTTVALPLVPTVAGRTLDVSAGGEAGVDWANVGSPTTLNNLSGTTLVATVTGFGLTAKEQINDEVLDAVANSGLATASALDTVDNFLDTEIAAIKAKTDLIPGTTDGKTFSELVTLFAAVLLGKASGLATTTAVYRAVDDSKSRVTATVDSSGNRSSVTLDAA